MIYRPQVVQLLPKFLIQMTMLYKSCEASPSLLFHYLIEEGIQLLHSNSPFSWFQLHLTNEVCRHWYSQMLPYDDTWQHELHRMAIWQVEKRWVVLWWVIKQVVWWVVDELSGMFRIIFTSHLHIILQLVPQLEKSTTRLFTTCCFKQTLNHSSRSLRSDTCRKNQTR